MSNTLPYLQHNVAGRADDNEIWAADDVVDAVEDDLDDGRPTPEFAFVYKQAVQTTDAFLGMDPMGKDPTSTSCEDLLLHVQLPGVSSVADIDLDLRGEAVTLSTRALCAHNSTAIAYVPSLER